MARLRSLTARLRNSSGWGEWLVLSLVAVGLVLLLDGAGLLQGANRLLQDTFAMARSRDVGDGQGKVVIVAIDDKSIASLGRWPWRRSFHAQVVDRVAQDGPRAIGLDLLLTEGDEREPGDDAALAAAMARSGKVVLPMMMQTVDGRPLALEPIAALRREALAIGHSHIAVDDDGVARGVFLQERLGQRSWSHLSVAMREAAAGGRAAGDGAPQGPPDGGPGERDGSGEGSAARPGRGEWQHLQKLIVPFAGPPGHFPQVSYVDVLDGEVPPGTFQGKYVLIGANAAAVGERYATPVSRRGSKLMSGVELTANVLDSLERGQHIRRLPAWLEAAINMALPCAALAAMAFVGPLPALVLVVGLLVAMPSGAAVLGMLGVEYHPLSGMLTLAVLYALWSWRRLDTATRYLMDEFGRLHREGRAVALPDSAAEGPVDFLGRRIHALRQTARELRNLHRLVSDSLESLPDPTLVCDRAGRVLLANAAAVRHFEVASGDKLQGELAERLMQDVVSPADRQPVATADIFAQPPATTSLAAVDSRQRDLLVKRAPSYGGKGEHLGWILSLVDVTQIRQAQRQRDHAMRFLSHDMRAPLASVLTLLSLQRQTPSAVPQDQFLERLERHAKKALVLADDFTQLVRAQSYNYPFDRENLVDVLLECVDDAWEAAQRHGIRITMSPASPDEAYCMMRRELVARAISNLLGNALKFSPAGSTVVCGVEQMGGAWAVAVQDQGPGIEPALQAQLFEPFVRASATAGIEGAGLGLAFVKTVAQRHGGQVLLESAPGRGSVFRLLLPEA